MPKIKDLTIRQEKFVNEVIQGKSYRKAAREAGYSKNTAINAHKDILAKPCVQDALKNRLKGEEIDANYILKNLKHDIDVSPEPNPCRTKSLELLGKHVGVFGDRGTNLADGKLSIGMPLERQEALFKDINEIINPARPDKKWAIVVGKLREWLNKLPENLHQEADEIFKDEDFSALMFARIDLTRALHQLGEEYRRRVPCGRCGEVTIHGAYNTVRAT